MEKKHSTKKAQHFCELKIEMKESVPKWDSILDTNAQEPNNLETLVPARKSLSLEYCMSYSMMGDMAVYFPIVNHITSVLVFNPLKESDSTDFRALKKFSKFVKNFREKSMKS